MKKAVAMVMAVMMVLVFSVTAFAANGPLTLEQAKQVALDYAKVNAADATFTKAHQDWENGRQVYEFEFYAKDTEYDIDVDANSGKVVKFSTERFYVASQQPAAAGARTPNYNTAPNGYYYDDDWYDWDDRYDYDDRYDWDDRYDYDDRYDWDDRYDFDDRYDVDWFDFD